MRVVIFCHSIQSDWNHGNAHFLRGVITALQRRGIEVKVYEPVDAWSVENLVKDYGLGPLERFRQAYPSIEPVRYDLPQLDLASALDGSDLVLVHEWNDPELVAAIGRYRQSDGDFCLLFHDTHHRSVTAPAAMAQYDLRDYDGVLAFGQSVAEAHRRHGWAERVWVWHEAADVSRFHPLDAAREGDLVWIGNWGDDERTAELHDFLFAPVKALGLRAVVHGVRYPVEGVASLREAGIEYRGWIANFDAPFVYAKFGVTVHVPRGPYTRALPGVPTIRVFEALACGIPLVSAPWHDSEGLFRPGHDFLVARNGAEMRQHLRQVLHEPDYARALSVSGLRSIHERHTCDHRVDELLNIFSELRGIQPELAGAGRYAN